MTERISEHLQDSLIYLSITNDDFVKLIVGQIPMEFFTVKHIYEVYKIVCNYYNKFKKAPGNHFHDEFIKYTETIDAELSNIISRYLEYLNERFTIEPDKEYILSRLNDFIRSKTYIKATFDFANLVEHGNFDEAQFLMQQTLKAGIHSQQIGIDFFSDEIVRKEKPERLFKLNIPNIDKCVFIKRTDFIAIAGIYKGGKSWFGHYLAYRALREGLNVVHVSHENSLDDTIIRYDMMIGGLISHSEKPEELEVSIFKDGKKKTIRKKWQSVFNKELVKKNRETFQRYSGRLIVQKYPMGSCSPAKLDSFLEQVETIENIKIDVCITDYADIMAPIDSSKQTRDSINDTYIYLKKIADDRKLVMVTMSQVNDEGIRTMILKGKLEGRHLAEDKRKFGNIDIGFFIGTNDEYEPHGEAIIGCFANRNGKTGYPQVIGQCLAIGQFCLYSYPIKRESKK